MIKPIFISIISGILFFTGTSVSIAETYIQANWGRVIAKDSKVNLISGYKAVFDYDKGSAWSGAVGARLTDDYDSYRAEVEIAYQKMGIKRAGNSDQDSISITGEVTNFAILANGYYDFLNDTVFTPFVGIGLGIAEITTNDTTMVIPNPELDSNSNTDPTIAYELNDNDIVFAHQLCAGVGYEFNPHFTIDFKYRYFVTTDPRFHNVNFDYVTHNIYLEIRYSF